MKTSKIRIIGGALKGNHISFPSSSKLRPTSNKLREILFNWLNFEIEGLKCADCFSGSGALGIEAISRGAKSVTFIEKTPKFAASIEANLERLNISDRCKNPKISVDVQLINIPSRENLKGYVFKTAVKKGSTLPELNYRRSTPINKLAARTVGIHSKKK